MLQSTALEARYADPNALAIVTARASAARRWEKQEMSRNTPPNKPLPAVPLKGGYQNKGLNSRGMAAPKPPPKPGALGVKLPGYQNKGLNSRGMAAPKPPPKPGALGVKVTGYQNKGLNSRGMAAPKPPPKPASFKPGNSEVYRYQDRSPKLPGALGGARAKANALNTPPNKPLPPTPMKAASPANRARTGTFGQAVAKPLPKPPVKAVAPAPPRPRTGTFGQPK
jgi:hypothetical protein